jgi:hypothetical protein
VAAVRIIVQDAETIDAGESDNTVIETATVSKPSEGGDDSDRQSDSSSQKQ